MRELVVHIRSTRWSSLSLDMAPSNITNDSGTPTPSPRNPDASPNGGSEKHHVPSTTQESQEKSKTVNGASQKGKQEKAADGKLSNAELKRQGKAEKAAKRALAKSEQSQTSKEPPKEKKVEASKDSRKQRSASQVQSQPAISSKQHRRTGSSSGSAQKPLPLRSSASQGVVAAPPPEPKKENKNVKLFGHLYSHPRRTTIAGASKDVHPAILALGLQMSSYIICGSNARCVATLLAFKRVMSLSSSIHVY